MKKWIKNNTYFFVQLCVTLFFLILLVVFLCIRSSVAASEWWTRHAISDYLYLFGNMNRWLPFSVTEVLIVLFVVALIVLLVMGIVKLCKKKWKTALHLLVFIPILALGAVAWYYGSAGIAYNREEVPLILYEEDLSEEELEEIVRYFANDYNEISEQLEYNEEGDVILPYTFDELNDILIEEYSKYESDYLSNNILDLKEMVFPWFFCEIGITGMFFSITTESIVNTMQPNASLPFTMLHELSHSRGCMREYDAQLMATFVAIQSDNIYVRYSGYFSTMYSMFNLASAISSSLYSELYNARTPQIKANVAYNNNFWDQYTLFEDIGTWFNDLYLKWFSHTDTSDYHDPGSSVTVEPSENPQEPPKKTITLSTYQKMYVSLYMGVLDIE
ncbi:MAG: DUF3810 family protein [Coprobacillus sp.]|nr:DUF3810 family protein [Coprobacillus sp.]